MFSSFKILVIYLIIGSRCANTSPATNGGKIAKTPIGELVEKELAPIEENLKMIVDSQTSNDRKFDLKGEVRGLVKKIIERAIMAECKVEQLIKKQVRLHKKQGRLETQNETFGKMLRLLGVRSRVETLVDDLYPYGRPIHIGVAKAYEQILTSTAPKFRDRSCIIVFRRRVKSYGISTRDFVDAIRSIYGSLSDNAAHKMSVFDPSPPNYDDVDSIKEMYKSFGITPDDSKIKTAQIILEPLPLLSTLAPTS